jgi:hypothetical protein
MLATITATIGIATWYSAPLGSPLYCDTWDTVLAYDPLAEWIAVDVNEYRTGHVQCGDLLLLRTPYGTVMARAVDAGPLHRFHLTDHPDLAIIADVPMHLKPFPGRSSLATWINITAMARLNMAQNLGGDPPQTHPHAVEDSGAAWMAQKRRMMKSAIHAGKRAGGAGR